MIQAVGDKIIVEVMKAGKTKGGIILPETVQDPQTYGRVISAGEVVTQNTDIKEGDFLVFHPRGGMDLLMEGRMLKVLKYDELYGILQNKSIEADLEPMVIGAKSKIVQV
jgi:co-chaperonin GroES (HSP10)